MTGSFGARVVSGAPAFLRLARSRLFQTEAASAVACMKASAIGRPCPSRSGGGEAAHGTLPATAARISPRSALINSSAKIERGVSALTTQQTANAVSPAMRRTATPGMSGAIVHVLPAGEIDQLLQVRVVVEVLAAELAAEYASETLILQLKDLCNEMIELASRDILDLMHIARLNNELHFLLIPSCSNIHLRRIRGEPEQSECRTALLFHVFAASFSARWGITRSWSRRSRRAIRNGRAA